MNIINMSTTTLKDFLKTYTAISEKFIDEYYKFYEMCERHMYGIYVDNVIKYLEITQPEHFIKRLRKNYEINKDYIILRKKKQEKSKKGQKQSGLYCAKIKLNNCSAFSGTWDSLKNKVIIFDGI